MGGSTMDVQPGWEICAPYPDTARAREDNLWMITSGVLVITMNAAFGLLESACVKRSNSLNIMMKNICDMTVGGFSWWLMGYTIAFCSTEKSICSKVDFLITVGDEAHWFFQWTFAATAATIDSGAVAERMAFLPYVFLSFLTTGLIYPFAVQWVWGGGFLSQFDPPFEDYAGGALVHTLGGTSALVAIMILGPRIGRFSDYRPSGNTLVKLICRRPTDEDYYMTPPGSAPIQPVTDPISLIWGTFFLWFGWYGFNPGAAIDVEGKGAYTIAHIVVNTTMGALGGGSCAFFIMLVRDRHRILADGLAMGTLAGLAAVTSGCKFFGNGASFLIGCLGSVMAVGVKSLLDHLHLDDAVSVIPVHLGGGLFGSIAVAFFAQPWDCTEAMGDSVPIGIFFAKGSHQIERAWGHVKVQVLGSLIIMGWVALTTFTMLTLLNQLPCLRLRVPRHVELEGMDSCEHSMGHEDLSFKRTIAELVANVAQGQSSEHVRKVFRRASRDLAMANIMPDMPFSAQPAIVQRPSGVCISVTVCSLEGVKPGHRSKLGCIGKPGIWVSVEPVSAVAEDGKLTIHHKYFAPRYTEVVTHEPYVFEHTFYFNDFLIPQGVEDFTFLLFGVHMHGRRALEAHLRVMEALLDDQGHTVGGAHTLTLHQLRGGDKMVEKDAKLHLRVCCPKNSQVCKSLSSVCASLSARHDPEVVSEASVPPAASATPDAFAWEPRAFRPNATLGVDLVSTQNLHSRVELLEQQVLELLEDRTAMTRELAKKRQAMLSLQQEVAALKRDNASALQRASGCTA